MSAKTVLVVDDNESLNRTFGRILRINGYDVDTATTGQQAIEKSRTKRYAVVVVDFSLGDMNGIEVLRQLDSHGCRMVKIIMSRYPLLDSEMDPLVDIFLQKPVSPQNFLALL